MTPEQFCYWLQGYAEMGSPAPNEEQWQVIKDHLKLAFKKETPQRIFGQAFAEQELLRRQLPPNDFMRQVTC